MSTRQIERFFSLGQVKSEAKENTPGTLSGTVARFNVLSEDRGGFREVFRPGAFANLGNDHKPDIVAYRDHDESVYLGRTLNGSLRLSVNDSSLDFALDLPATRDGEDTAVLVARGDLVGMSFGMYMDKYRYKNEAQGPIREHFSCELFEISVVFTPAFPRTNVSLNSLTEVSPETLKELDEFLRSDSGCPVRNAAARKLVIAEMLNRSHT